MSRAEAPCVKRRVVESADAVHFHVGTTRIRSRHAVHGSWTALAGPAPLRRRRRAEMLVGGHVRCDCERHGTLIENRSTTVDAQVTRLQRSSCDRGPATKCATLRCSLDFYHTTTASDGRCNGGRRVRGRALRRGLPRYATTMSTAGAWGSRSTSAARRWPHRPPSRSPSTNATNPTGAAHERHTTFLNTYHHHHQAAEALMAARSTAAPGNANALRTVDRLAATKEEKVTSRSISH